MLNHHMTTKMELHLKNKTSSQDLLACGNGGGLHDKLLLKSKGPKAGSLQTERVPRSNVLDRLQNFLPQMAQANEKLKLLMEQAPEGHYDIERVEEDGKVIEMDVSLVELSSSDSGSDRESSQDSDSDSEEESEVTEESLKLPGNNQRKKKKVNIQVLEKQED